jgi:hypothetical protein
MSMDDNSTSLEPGGAIYVPRGETSSAMSLGAIYIEADARLHIPSPLPSSVDLESFSRWSGSTAKIVWISEMLESIIEAPVDLTDVAGLVAAGDVASDPNEEHLVPLYVPKFEMDMVRQVPGVSWDRRKRVYVADRSADFGLIYRYLTPAMRAVWIADRNIDMAMGAMIRARALIENRDDGDQLDPIEHLPGGRVDADGD